MQMPTQKSPSPGRLARWAAGLRFPRLLLLTSGIFLVDLLVPDFLPFVDEILLGLLSLILASIRTRRGEQVAGDAAPKSAAAKHPR